MYVFKAAFFVKTSSNSRTEYNKTKRAWSMDDQHTIDIPHTDTTTFAQWDHMLIDHIFKGTQPILFLDIRLFGQEHGKSMQYLLEI